MTYHKGGSVTKTAQEILIASKTGNCKKFIQKLKDVNASSTLKDALNKNKKEIAKLSSREGVLLMKWIMDGFKLESNIVTKFTKVCHENYKEITGGECVMKGGNRCYSYCGLVGGKKKTVKKQ